MQAQRRDLRATFIIFADNKSITIKNKVVMNYKHQAKVEKREAKQKKQAEYVIWGIIIGLIVLAAIFVISYSVSNM